jgi:hypothetical protein
VRADGLGRYAQAQGESEKEDRVGVHQSEQELTCTNPQSSLRGCNPIPSGNRPGWLAILRISLSASAASACRHKWHQERGSEQLWIEVHQKI